jgi:AcrR family transcriptional regulator
MVAARRGRTPLDSATTIEAVLEAAAACFQRFGVAKTTIEDIAAQSGLSKATIYRYVPGGREGIVVTVLVRAVEARLSELTGPVEQLPTFASQLITGIPLAVDLIRSDEQLSYLFSADLLGAPDKAHTAIPPMLAAVERFLTPLLARARSNGELSTGLSDARIAEWILRVMHSFVTFDSDGGAGRQEVQALVRDFVGPSLLQSTAREVDGSQVRSKSRAAQGKRPSRSGRTVRNNRS